MTVVIDGNSLTLEDIQAVARGERDVRLPASALPRVLRAREYVERLLADNAVVYGVTTGFGRFADVHVSGVDALALQRNLVFSHCCGVGEPLGPEETRAMMLLRANVLAKGYSGARPVVLETLLAMLNGGVLPVIPVQGSVGACGDLAPLAHLTAVLIGEGEAMYLGRRMPGGEALRLAGIDPLVLQAKEGLALINGTQMMTALGVLSLLEAENLSKAADIAAAQAVEALRGTRTPYLERTHLVRPHAGQLATARNLVRLLEHSEILASHAGCGKVQDAYCLRCAPQVHGAAKDALAFVRGVLEVEVNAATDNPLVFPEEELVVSGGNFHGQPLSQAMDILALALAQLANISERRVECMMDPSTSDHLPAFLTAHGGLNSGLMIAQVTAAALVSENKTLAHPACVDSIPTSANKEDFVSMGAFAARKARQVVGNALRVVAIELLCGAQGLEFRGGLRAGLGVAAAHDAIREMVAALAEDRPQTPDIETISQMVRGGSLVRRVESVVGPLEP
ncbi:MAG: histidine ammonia-lyase [Gaiellales bacterium]|nr:histidine ammonia-lyase [Gaiellales bacterium]